MAHAILPLTSNVDELEALARLPAQAAPDDEEALAEFGALPRLSPYLSEKTEA